MSASLFSAVTPVHEGDPHERAALVRSLIADGADVSARDKDGATPLHRAVKAPRYRRDPLPSLEVVRVLLECGADVHAVDDSGVTPAALAVASDDTDPATWAERSVEVLALLVEHGARLDGVTRGFLAHNSCASVPVYAFLLDHGAPIDTADDRGDTPLHATVRSQRPGLVKLLLERGADTAAVNNLGRTPLGIALRLPQYSDWQQRTRAEILALLQAAGAPEQVRYPMVEGGPIPIDMDTVRQVAGAMRADRAETCKDAGIRDDSGWLARIVEPDFDSYQDFVAHLRETLDPDLLSFFPQICAKSLGDTATTRTLIGDQRLDVPFFHHGDLVVKGHLDVVAPFVVTGSLTVEGVLGDAGPYSVVVIGGGVTARAVFTDGEMEVGDIDAEVVYAHYNDHTLQAGTISARLVIEDEHYTIADVEADHHYDLDTYEQGYGAGVQQELRELLVDEVFDADEDEEDDEDEDEDDEDDEDEDEDEEDDEDGPRLNHHLLYSRMRDGLPVFRAESERP